MRSRRREVVWVLALASAMTFAVAESGYAQAQNTEQNPDEGSQQPPAPQSDPATNEPTQPRPELTRRPVAPATSSAAKPEDQPAGPKVEIPTGTHIALVLNNAVSTRSAKPGDPVYFETIYPVMVGGKVAIPAGSWVSGEVTESKRAGRVKGRAELMVRLTTMILPNAYTVNLAAVPSGAGTGGGETVDSEGKVIGDSNKASDIGTVAKTTAAGAGLGGIATRNGEGAGIGAGIGAAVGIAAVLLTRGPDAELPRGSTLEAVLDHPLLLDADKDQFSSPGQASTVSGPPHRDPQGLKIPF